MLVTSPQIAASADSEPTGYRAAWLMEVDRKNAYIAVFLELQLISVLQIHLLQQIWFLSSKPVFYLLAVPIICA